MKLNCVEGRSFIPVLAVVALMASVCSLSAAPVDAHTAADAARGWLSLDGHLDESLTHHKYAGIFTDRADDGTCLYHVAHLKPAGYVILAADSRLSPVPAFSASGRFDTKAASPLRAVVRHDIAERLRALKTNAARQPAGAPSRNEREWQELVRRGTSAPHARNNGLASIDDVCVAPLVKSKWGQDVVSNRYDVACFNYYTPPYEPGAPSNYFAGCVATVMSQLMRYHEWPQTGIGTKEYSFYVDGVPTTDRTFGGGGTGAPYPWSEMPFDPHRYTPESQLRNIGRLLFDCGLTAHTDYAKAGSTALTPDLVDAMTSVFCFTNAIKGYDLNWHPATLSATVNANLDAGFPVVLEMQGYFEGATNLAGHAAVCDGYGYHLFENMYHHLNLGWTGHDDIWYRLPSVETGTNIFTSVTMCVYNIFPDQAGELVSGRVYGDDGQPLAGATVQAVHGATTNETSSDARGIYAFRNVPPNTEVSLRATPPAPHTYTFPPATAATGQSVDWKGESGNCWGIDFRASTYVAAGGSHAYPFTSWSTAATNIAAAVSACPNGSQVLISNGTHRLQGTVVVTNAITITSTGGAEATVVDGDNSAPCFVLQAPGSRLEHFTVRGGAGETGGGVRVGDGAILRYCTLTDCAATGRGGGVYCVSGGFVDHCVITGNTARQGGGAYVEAGGLLRNSLIADNSAQSAGGGLYLRGGARLSSCTVSANDAGACGGGVYCENSAGFRNAIIYFNTAGNAGSNVYDHGAASVFTNCCTAPLPSAGSNNTADDPLFGDAPDGDFLILQESPCVDAGTNESWMVAAVDIAGRGRLGGDHVDMGAYEAHGGPVYVSTGGANIAPYDTWGKAANSIQSAVTAANPGDAVVVGGGDYALTHPVILDKAIAVRGYRHDPPPVVSGGNASQCFYVNHDDATLERFTLEHGWATNGGAILIARGVGRDLTITGSVAITYGGGVFLAADARLEDSLVVGNTGFYGGGVYAQLGGSLSSCTLSNNIASDRGGGIALIHGGGAHSCNVGSNQAVYGGGIYVSSVGDVADCSVSGNRATVRAGGVHLHGGGTLTDSLVVGNRTGAHGGGVFLESGGACRRTVCDDNDALQYGGGLFIQNSGSAENVLVVRNGATQFGGGVMLYGGGSLRNCTVVTNTCSDGNGNGLYCYNASSTTNCIVYDNYGPNADNIRGSGTPASFGHCITAPVVTGPHIYTDAPGFRNPSVGDYRLKWGALAIDRGAAAGAPADDLRGYPRPTNGNLDSYAFFDIGAYEHNPDIDDTDGDGQPDGHEYIAGTDPDDSGSFFAVTAAEPLQPAGTLVIEWPGTAGRLYDVYLTPDLDGTWSIAPGGYGLPGTGSPMRYTNAPAPGGFFEVRARLP